MKRLPPFSEQEPAARKVGRWRWPLLLALLVVLGAGALWWTTLR